MKSKKIHIILIAIVVALVAALLYFTVVHPRVKTYLMMQAVYEEFGGDRYIGEPIVAYDQAHVTDDSLVMTDFGTFRLGIPSDWENQSKEDSDIIIYRTIGAVVEVGETTDCESMAFSPTGYDDSGLAILNNEELYEESELSDADIRHLENGFEKLGYGMPDSAYATLKCAYSITPEDYNFFVYDKSLAYAYVLVHRAGTLYYSNGDTAKTYYYETDDVCVLINEQYRPDYDGKYHFKVGFYDADDLNTEYIFTITVDDKETGYAIINSLTFNE